MPWRRPLLTTLLLLSLAASVGARWDYDQADVESALRSASPRAACIVRLESGGDPNAVGALGEMGAAQLAPFGLLGDFRAQGYRDPFNPYEAVEYLDGALARGLAHHWTAARWC